MQGSIHTSVKLILVFKLNCTYLYKTIESSANGSLDRLSLWRCTALWDVQLMKQPFELKYFFEYYTMRNRAYCFKRISMDLRLETKTSKDWQQEY